jgi:hypothetical protein
MPRRETETIRLDFSKGVNEAYESSTLPEGYASSLRNWIAEPNGVLRVPRAFRSASTAGLTGTRAARGIVGWVHSSGPVAVVAVATSPTQYQLKYLDRDALSSASWTTADTVSVTSSDGLVAMASGIGVLLHSRPDYPSSRIRYVTRAGATGTASTDAFAGRALAFHVNRFFAGGNSTNPTHLRWSNLSSYTLWTTDPIANHQPISEDDGEPIEALEVWDRALFIGKESSIHYMTGTGPTNFAFRLADGGGVAPGKTLIPTPDGIIAVGRERVYLMSGGGFEPISQPIEGNYGMTGDFMTGCYINGVVYICDEGSGVIWRLDTALGTWSTFDTDEQDEGPNSIHAVGPYLMAGVTNGASNSIALFRAEPGDPRGRVAHAGQTFTLRTGEMWLAGAGREWTIRRAHLALRQHGGDETQAGLTLTVYDQESEVASTETIGPFDEAGTYRQPISLGRSGSGSTIEITQTVTNTQTSLFDIEAVEIEFDVNEPR